MSARIALEEWKNRLKQINPYMSILNSTQPKGDKIDPYICHCNKCGATFNETSNNLKAAYSAYKDRNDNGYWCPVCHRQLCVAGINDVSTIRPDLVKFFMDKNESKNYMIGSKHIVMCKCPDCGYKKQMSICDLNTSGFNCEICSDSISFPNKICRNFILQLPVEEFDFEYQKDWSEGRIYDGYFKYKNKKYLLEFDGEQHYKSCIWRSYDEQRKIDEQKTTLAINNGYIIIRIDCRYSDFNYIKNNIINSELKFIFDLTIIDWVLIYTNANKNFNFEVSEYYMSNKNKSLKYIAEYFHISYARLVRILKTMTDLGFCDYKHRITSINCRKYISDRRKGKIFYFNVLDEDGNIISTFESIEKCIDFFKDMYKDINLSRYIVESALFTGDLYKGFKFEYQIGLNEYHKNNVLLFEICSMYSNNNMTTKDIADHYNISLKLVYKYLRTGHNMGICNYKIINYSNSNWQQAC